MLRKFEEALERWGVVIEAVLFDVGGVLIGPKPKAVTDLLQKFAATWVPPEVAARSLGLLHG